MRSGQRNLIDQASESQSTADFARLSSSAFHSTCHGFAAEHANGRRESSALYLLPSTSFTVHTCPFDQIQSIIQHQHIMHEWRHTVDLAIFVGCQISLLFFKVQFESRRLNSTKISTMCIGGRTVIWVMKLALSSNNSRKVCPTKITSYTCTRAKLFSRLLLMKILYTQSYVRMHICPSLLLRVLHYPIMRQMP